MFLRSATTTIQASLNKLSGLLVLLSLATVVVVPLPPLLLQLLLLPAEVLVISLPHPGFV